MKVYTQQAAVKKVLTGIQGFDEITGGGLPAGRTSLFLGGPGCGKTVFAIQTLVNVAHNYKGSRNVRGVRGEHAADRGPPPSGGICRRSKRGGCSSWMRA